MDFLSVRELRASSRNIWRKLSQDGKMVITNNGKPTALLLDISNEDLEETLLVLRQVKFTLDLLLPPHPDVNGK